MSDLFDDEREALDNLAARFLRALELRRLERHDAAEDMLRDLLKTEPRLPEPRMELARVLLDSDRLTEAEGEAREALTHLDAGGQWTDDLPDHVVRALAHGLLAEILRRRADEDQVIFGDPATFKQLVAESKQHFARAAELDPSDEYSSYHAFFLGPDRGGAPQADPDLPLLAPGEPGEA
jgi:tetratricopeptide (TPR) repeat protein